MLQDVTRVAFLFRRGISLGAQKNAGGKTLVASVIGTWCGTILDVLLGAIPTSCPEEPFSLDKLKISVSSLVAI